MEEHVTILAELHDDGSRALAVLWEPITGGGRSGQTMFVVGIRLRLHCQTIGTFVVLLEWHVPNEIEETSLGVVSHLLMDESFLVVCVSSIREVIVS